MKHFRANQEKLTATCSTKFQYIFVFLASLFGCLSLTRVAQSKRKKRTTEKEKKSEAYTNIQSCGSEWFLFTIYRKSLFLISRFIPTFSRPRVSQIKFVPALHYSMKFYHIFLSDSWYELSDWIISQNLFLGLFLKNPFTNNRKSANYTECVLVFP